MSSSEVISFLFFYGFGLVAAVYIHEAAHLVCGCLVGLQTLRLTIGRGRTLLRWRVFETEIVIRLIPFGGLVQIYPALITRIHAYLIILAAGALANAVVLILLIALFPWSGDSNWAQAAAWGVGASQVAVILRSMVPYGTATGGSDGFKILSLLRAGIKGQQPCNVYASKLQVYGWPITILPKSKASTRIYYWSCQMGTEAGRKESGPALIRELSRDGLSEPETLLILDSLVTNQLMYRDLGLHEQLNELSDRALTLAPEIETLRGSRGAALVEIGRYDEGAALLKPLAKGEPTFDSVVSLLFLARAEHALNKKASAVELLDAARTILKTYSPKEAVALFERTENELAS